jgi:hypothetical protein
MCGADRIGTHGCCSCAPCGDGAQTLEVVADIKHTQVKVCESRFNELQATNLPEATYEVRYRCAHALLLSRACAGWLWARRCVMPLGPVQLCVHASRLYLPWLAAQRRLLAAWPMIHRACMRVCMDAWRHMKTCM